MLTRLQVQNFRLFESLDIELGDRVTFIGPNNSGKTTALQALFLWDFGFRQWLEKNGPQLPKQNELQERRRVGVAINRQDLYAIPLLDSRTLWHNLRVRSHSQKGEKPNKFIDVTVSGVSGSLDWRIGLHFDYANSESLYCRPHLIEFFERGQPIDPPPQLSWPSMAFLLPMSGLVSREDRLELGSIRMRLGEGRTAEVLRNLCWQVYQRDDQKKAWHDLVARMKALFGVSLHAPEYHSSTGLLSLRYTTSSGVELDILSSGRGQPASSRLEGAFVHYVGNDIQAARRHFYGLREAYPNLRGLAIFDRLEGYRESDEALQIVQWSKREIENYFSQKETLVAWAEFSFSSSLSSDSSLPAVSHTPDYYRKLMEDAISEVEAALITLGKQSHDMDLKASEEWLIPVLNKFYQKSGLSRSAKKSELHQLVEHVSPSDLHGEVTSVLNQILQLASADNP